MTRLRTPIVGFLIAMASSAVPAAASPVLSLSIERARQAIVATSARGSDVDRCRRLSPVQVRCVLTEREVSTPTTAEPEGVEVINVLEGPATVTLKRDHGMTYLRVHVG